MVVMMKTSNRWLGLLGAAAILSSTKVLAYSSDSSSSGCIPDFYADGDCDYTNNNAECGYDSGDCCACTCQDADIGCGSNGFACIDPDAECVDDDDITVDMAMNCGWLPGVGNGYCDHENNNAGCGYDGGDCCECTCTTADDGSWDDEYVCSSFACVDPSAECVDDDDVTIEMFESCGWFYGRGDGWCDQENNNAGCGYDGGDCCPCTCQAPENSWDDDWSCSVFGCIDPDAPCVDDDDITVDMVENCGYIGSIGNGYCNEENNKAECGYDGGDCCSCTCQAPENAWDDDWSCSVFGCVDPDAPCVDDDDITVDMVENCGYIGSIGNGYCDEENNKAECGYDGGDCCECTCVPPVVDDDWSDDWYVGCGNGFACIDPDAPCVNDDDITIGLVEACEDSARVGNGHCDIDNNNPECAYDGGDCCECTCEDTPNNKCGQYDGFACIDPDAPCVDDDDITIDMFENCGWIGGISNGYCDEDNNKPECNYDGGDCCECTCDPSNNPWDDEEACGRWAGFACIDPAAPCVDDDSVTVDMIDNCYASGIGDGYCDDYNNHAECAYDGGDCCECTCQSDFDDDCRWGFACIDPDAACVNDDDITIEMIENCGWVNGIGNGYCDDDNNKEECGYDGGDCCECTCVPNERDDDGDPRWAGCTEFACIDPNADCVDEDDFTVDMLENCGYALGIGNGYCDRENNNEACNFDGGDCCSCTCEYQWDDDWACNADGSGFDCQDTNAPCYGEGPTGSMDDDEVMSYSFVPWEQEGPLPVVDGAVEVGTKTEVAVTATGHDLRPGAHVGQVGCGEEGGDGCAPANAHDGISSEVESRWSCASKLVEDEGPCQIEFTFGEPQDIVDILVAFWKGNERIRTLNVHLDGLHTHTHESYSEAVFNTLGVEGTGVSNVMLESVELEPSEWISLIEVLIFVTP